ncbi:MAG: hypothetical protein ACI857_000191 [Arenicella sp.]|jgi:hypothetical protein
MKKAFLLILTICIQLFTFAQENQNIQFSKIESGSYQVYKAVEKGYNKFSFVQAKKNWPVELFSEGDNYPKVLIKRVGIIDEFYNADLPDYPAYYLNSTSSTVVTVIDKKIYYYTWSASKGATITYILSMNSPGKFLDEKAKLDTYRRAVKKAQSGAREVRVDQNAAIASKSAEENSLKGKSIKSIKLKLIDAPSEIGMLTVVSVGIEVELADGKILKTKNLGGKTPYSDFETKVSGGDYAGGDFKIANDSRQIPNDKIEIQVSSKFDSNVKGEFSHPINYKSDIFYQYQGNGGVNGRGATSGKSVHGGNGKDGKNVNVTAEKLTVNGQTITKVIITDASSGKLLAEAKVHLESKLTINVSGGRGGGGDKGSFSGDVGGDGGDGGNGGDVTMSGSGASQLKIIVMNNGGSAGTAGSGNDNTRSGSKGSRGVGGNFLK